MMKIVSIVLQVIFVSAGALGGLWLKSGGGDSDASHEEAEAHGDEKSHDAKDDHDEKSEKKKEKKKKKKKSDHGGDGDHGEGASGQSGFMKFSRQFIVPVIRTDNVNALLVIDINLELTPDSTDNAYSREPKIRDALLSELLALSNQGAFEENLLKDENVQEIRARLLSAARTVLGEDALDVLILSIARQDI